jgi:hypothetical protein
LQVARRERPSIPFLNRQLNQYQCDGINKAVADFAIRLIDPAQKFPLKVHFNRLSEVTFQSIVSEFDFLRNFCGDSTIPRGLMVHDMDDTILVLLEQNLLNQGQSLDSVVSWTTQTQRTTPPPESLPQEGEASPDPSAPTHPFLRTADTTTQ